MRRCRLSEVPLPPDLELLADLDRELLELVLRVRQKALYTDGALPSNVKLLMAAVVDAAADNQGGASILIRRAMARGATSQQVAEALGVLYSVSGLRPLLVGLRAYKEASEV